MTQFIAWSFNRLDNRFVLKFSDMRMVKVKSIDIIARMDEEVQRDILALCIPTLANQCERTKTLIRSLKRKFQEDDDDLELPTSWSLKRMMRVTYSNGDEDSFTMDEVLNTENVRLL
ncbi:hypothetical protein Hanom_Chr00s000001g01592251 [Helianthus anomalus]